MIVETKKNEETGTYTTYVLGKRGGDSVSRPITKAGNRKTSHAKAKAKLRSSLAHLSKEGVEVIVFEPYTYEMSLDGLNGLGDMHVYAISGNIKFMRTFGIKVRDPFYRLLINDIIGYNHLIKWRFEKDGPTKTRFFLEIPESYWESINFG